MLITVLVINALAFFVMLAGSAHSGSSSLLSGALDNLGDALTYALSLAVVGASMAAKARVALFKGILIFAAAVAVAAQIVWRLSGELSTPVPTSQANLFIKAYSGGSLVTEVPLRVFSSIEEGGCAGDSAVAIGERVERTGALGLSARGQHLHAERAQHRGVDVGDGGGF